MANELYLFPRTISGGEYSDSDGNVFPGLHIADETGQAVNLIFRPEALRQFAEQFAALQNLDTGIKPN